MLPLSRKHPPALCKFESVAGVCRVETVANFKKEGDKMTIDAINEAIKRLIIKRREAHGNEEEQKRINEKLTKLYNIKFLSLQQEANKKK